MPAAARTLNFEGKANEQREPVFAWERRLGLAEHVASKYIECRLTEGYESVDELLSFARWAALPLFERLRARADKTGAGRDWSVLSGFARKWAASDSSALDRVPAVWLEFDGVTRSGAQRALPSPSACLVPGYDPYSESSSDPHHDLGTAREVLRVLGANLERIDPLLRACFRALPPRARFIHVSYMLGRSPRAVKLYGTMRRAALLPYLTEIGFRGDPSALRSVLARLYPRSLLGEEVFIDLNLENFRSAGEASLGLAVGQQHVARGRDRDPARRALLETWTSAGICSSARARAVRRWLDVGTDEEWTRFLDLKLVVNPQGLIAKAYLGARRRSPGW